MFECCLAVFQNNAVAPYRYLARCANARWCILTPRAGNASCATRLWRALARRIILLAQTCSSQQPASTLCWRKNKGLDSFLSAWDNLMLHFNTPPTKDHLYASFLSKIAEIPELKETFTDQKKFAWSDPRELRRAPHCVRLAP